MKEQLDSNIVIIHHVNGGRFAFTQDEILNAIQVKNHIKNVIDKCKYEKEEIQNECYTSIAEQHLSEERYEYLDNLQSKLQFMIDYPEREQSV